MLELPSRRALTALAESANAVLPTAAIGFTHQLDDGRVQVLYLSTHGIGAHVLSAADVPESRDDAVTH